MKNKMKHTPGPLVVQMEETPVIVTRTDAAHPTGAIAKVYRNDKRAKADAAMLSAAPELFDALKLHLAFLDSLPKGWIGDTVADIGLLNDAYLASSAAIAKATGGSQ